MIEQPPLGSAQANKRVVEQLFDDVWNAQRTDLVERFYSPDVTVDYRPYAPLRTGHAAIREMVERAWDTMPDYHEECLAAVAEGNRVAVHLRISGTQSGPWGPIAPTGRRLEFEEMLMLTFDDQSLVLHQRGVVDNLLGLRQAGVMPTPTDH